MPTTTEILADLARLTNALWPLAVLWHLATLAALVALLSGWRPRNRLGAALLAAPVATVGAVALVSGNLFNGALFFVLAVAMVALGLGLPGRSARGPAWAAVLGALLVGFAWVYPHFLQGSPLGYLVAAPMGVIPCPTLSLVTGFALLAGGFGGRGYGFAVAGAGLFYGLFGALRLGVTLDLALAAGAVALLVVAELSGARRPSRRALGHA